MIAVTGATGHIGNVLVRKLLAKNENIRAIVPPFEDAKSLEGLDVEIARCDVRDAKCLISAFHGAEIVYHLAGIVTIMSGNDKLLNEVNVKGTRNVVDACLKTDIRRLVYTSSIHALKEPPHGITIDETCPFDTNCARGGYDKSKTLASLEVLEGVEKGLDAVMVCPSGVIGPYDYYISQMGQMILNFMNGKLKAYIEGAYDFVDVRDVANGHILACKYGKRGEHYILSGEQITVYDLFLMLEEITGVKAPSLKVPMWLAKVGCKFVPIHYKLTGNKPLFTTYSVETLNSNSKISCEKAQSELGFSFRSIRESIKDSVEWFKENRKL